MISLPNPVDPRALLGLAVILFACCGTTLPAANSTWQSSSGDWTTAGNWNAGVPTSADTAFFGNAPADGAVSVNIDGPQSINIFTFSNTGSRTYTFSGSDLTFLTKGSETDARISMSGAATSAITINNNIVIADGFGAGDNAARFTIGGTSAGTSNFTTITINGNILAGSGAGTKTLAVNTSETATIILNGSNTNQNFSFAGLGDLIVGNSSAFGVGSVQKTTASTLSLRSDVTVQGNWTQTTGSPYTFIRISEVAMSSADRTFTINDRIAGSTGAIEWIDNINSTGKLILELKYNGGTAQSLPLITNSSAIVRFAQAPSAARTYSGLISGAGSVELTAGGSTVLTAANTYTGTTTISNGTLLISGSGTIQGTSELRVGTGATFNLSGITPASYTFGTNQTISGTGTVVAGNKNIILQGGLSPGNSPGTLTFNMGSGTLLLDSTVDITFDLGTSQDLIVLSSGILDIGSGVFGFDNFNFVPGAGFAPGTYTLFQTPNTIQGTFSGITSGILGGTYIGEISLQGTNMILNVSVIPEPSTAALLLGLGGLFALLRRRRIAI